MIRPLLPVLCACLFLAGCIKLTVGPSEPEVVLRGRLVEDCSGNAVAGGKVQAVIMKGNFPSRGERAEVVGTSETSADGSFELKLSKQAAIWMFLQFTLPGGKNFDQPNPLACVSSEMPTPGKVYELGDIYSKQVPVYVKFVANVDAGLQMKDSLIIQCYGISAVYSPVPAQIIISDTAFVQKGVLKDSNLTVSALYSTSKAYLHKPNTNGNIYNKRFEVLGSPCTTPNPSTITLNW